jgi:prevent-host-death family protein
MKAAEITPKRVAISEFKAHCTEYLRAIENGEAPIEITRHGKVVAQLTKTNEPIKKAMTMADCMGGLKGTVIFSSDYDPHTPAFEDDEWEMNKD